MSDYSDQAFCFHRSGLLSSGGFRLCLCSNFIFLSFLCEHKVGQGTDRTKAGVQVTGGFIGIPYRHIEIRQAGVR